MKRILFFLLLALTGLSVNAQSVGIGTSTPNAKAALEINSTTKGLLIPSMTTSQRLAITSASQGPGGLMVYDTDRKEFYHYTGTTWSPILNGDYWSRGIASRDRIGNVADSIGLGTLSPTARLDVRGNVRIADGNEAAGKVLTSDANGRATWENAALTSNDRIFVTYTSVGIEDSLINGATVVYDNGPGISYLTSSTKFIILKSGLYHFEGTSSAKYSSLTGAPDNLYLQPYMFVNGLSIPLTSNLTYISGSAWNQHTKIVLPLSIDMYFTSGTQIQFKFSSSSFLGFENFYSGPGYISAYLISE
jgi:hypothetical protein